MKECKWCKTIKPFSDFTKNKREKDGYRRVCRSCSSLYEQKRYKKDRTLRATHAVGQARRKHRNRLFVCNYLTEHTCIDCGESDPIVLEFDHINDDKEYNISLLVAAGYSLSKIQKEIDKCVVRCANCHRRKTFSQLGWYDKNSPEYDLSNKDKLDELRSLIPKKKVLGSQHINAKLNEDDVRAIKKMIENGASDRKIAAQYNVSGRLIFNIRKGISWKHV